MATINLNFDNMGFVDILLEILQNYPNEYELTEKMVFRKKVPPKCENCGERMTHNGYNEYTKKHLGTVRIGKYHCSMCEKNIEEDRTFWEEMNTHFFEIIINLVLKMNTHNLSLEAISDILMGIFPRSKSWVASMITNALENIQTPFFTKILDSDDFLIVHYDEQFLKINGVGKCRLTLLDKSGEVIGEELFDEFTPEGLMLFLLEYLDPNRRTFIVTDGDTTYPGVFKVFFNVEYIHQRCLFHLNQNIVKGFRRNGSMANEYLKYRLLNIFYNRERELAFLHQLVEREKQILKDPTIAYQKWLKQSRRDFRKFLHELEKERRRNKQNLELRSYDDSSGKMIELIREYNTFPDKIQKRLRLIAKNWEQFAAFHYVEGAPATNNRIENYYSRSIKTHRKKQFRSDKGVEERIKLTILKIKGYFSAPKVTLLDYFQRFLPFLSLG